MAHPSLTPAETERLHLLIEECAEVQQAATKILRHGYESYHPREEKYAPDKRMRNRQDLAQELADLKAVVSMMTAETDVHMYEGIVDEAILKKLRYTYHQEGSEL